jgi:imidazolonepropionase-like amidohydrolase
VGSLESGKDADVVVFSGHPFDYRTVVKLVLVDGQVAYRRDAE